MDIDFHTHGKLTRKLPFSEAYTAYFFEEARAAGLDAICVTEHFNTWQFCELYDYVARIGQREGDTLVLPNGLRVFSGMETDIAEGGHILSLGAPEAIAELNIRLAPYKEKGSYLSFERLMELFAAYPVMVGGAHPYRAGGHIPELPMASLRRLHFLDLNGKELAYQRSAVEQQTYALGERLGIPVVSGSDTHQAAQFGCVRTRMENACTTIAELHAEMREGRFAIRIAEDAPYRVRTAATLKRALKAVHTLGGDYVQILTGA